MPLDLTGKAFAVQKRKAIPFDESYNDSQSSNTVKWTPVKPKYKLSDLILDDSTRENLLDAVSLFFYQEKLMNEWGLAEHFADRANISVNLYGKPGTGKTMAAHAIAYEMGKEILFVDYAEIESKYVGETAKNIKQLFETAAVLDAVIIFDEADALLSKRVTDMRSSTDVSVNQTRSVLLNILNDYSGTVIFTTNFIQNFDPAFIRRIRYQIRLDLPNEELRRKLWQMYIPKQMPTNVDIESLAKKFDGVSGSDISNAVFSAAVKAARCGLNIVDGTIFESAIDQIIQASKANKGFVETVEKRTVSEEYVKEQLKIKEI